MWRPYDFGVAGSLGSLAVNNEFAADNPTAVEDFLRASQHAFDYCGENGEECVAFASELSGEGYDAAHNLKVWTTEYDIVTDNQPADAPIGLIDFDNVTAESRVPRGQRPDRRGPGRPHRVLRQQLRRGDLRRHHPDLAGPVTRPAH